MKNKRLFNDQWKDYFYLHKSLRKGFVILFSILSIEILALLYIHFSPDKHQSQDLAKFNSDVEKFLASAQADTLTDEDSIENKSTKRDFTKTELFPFNPNNLPTKDWKRLGFSEKQIQVIKNYESKGGRFYSKNDVKKMYSISEKEFKHMEPYIVIPARSAQVGKAVPKAPPSEGLERRLIVDLSTADTTELEKLHGIGPVKARIIYQYREKLGGFYSINQLHEVWGMNDSLFESLEPHLALSDSVNLKKINLNKAELSEFGKHPYIGFNLAKIIVNYRKEHGIFHSPDEVRKIPLVTDALYSKMAHYLTVHSD